MMETSIKRAPGPKLNLKTGVIELSHGSGGRAMMQLINELFLPAFNNSWLDQKNDQACFTVDSGRMVMTTDAHVISPLFFPGGNIGLLAVHGTINDVVMSGAKPLYLSVSFILEEGFPLVDLKKIVTSMADAALAAKVAIITGDTKVVERGKGDGVFISTTGLGVVPEGIHISGNQAKPGDKVILSGYIGDHGIAILSQRNHLEFSTTIQSDTAALHDLVSHMLNAVPSIHCLRDPTRGGVASTLNEWAMQSQVGFIIDETQIPIRTEVAGACELLGLDTLYVANEGKLLAICAAEDSEKLIRAMRCHPLGEEAAIIGEVVEDPYHFVQLRTKLGGLRIMDWLSGEQLPRIC
ncbi:hydrogenase expression/formation protein HypE [Legionella nautarum]|uniref:Hydrogenase expression/formation protein HypE n=1 Tax=Legionella nautarum TaxID=45070 RepID=A0A0W0WRV4_9GAMM|nr:hydrogenase expression/formation protein HypE [Legionella nautarum]KTD35047.1 hydrogenase expression/formation protein HypE [Legionella nautarum]